ncbi:MAG: hypothetical protein JXB49_36315 [Bacteroidales bacterium]|nr:hypothetical protein [Bacteroidales bacterium]
MLITICSYSQEDILSSYNVVWSNQSKNSSESMPCGGRDIGLNVWVENGDILFYISRSGTFDEHNSLLKLGRVRIRLSPNPFNGKNFKQELILQDGYIKITGEKESIKATCTIWVDVYEPVIHVNVESNANVEAKVIYENWRYKDRLLRKNESFANSYKWHPPDSLMTYHDVIEAGTDNITFYHQNKSQTVFDVTVDQQGLTSVKEQLYNPLGNLTFGGTLRGNNLIYEGTFTDKYLDTDYTGWILKSKEAFIRHQITIYLHTKQTPDILAWKKGLEQIIYTKNKADSWQKNKEWWNEYWNRSFVFINPENLDTADSLWQIGRNYQLFRYMLGCNAYGNYPTKFNGGLFTYDPCFTNKDRCFTPDFRNWGGGTFTAQNQRLVYFPMIKSGDFDMMESQFDFYLRILKTAELRSEIYWGHKGACFTEQLENFGLPNCSEYGWDRPDWYDKGMQYNAWLEYQWDTDLEFCLMMLDMERYTGQDISEYIPFIESCLSFFDEHYQYLARMRGRKTLDKNKDLILYPGSACETYKMAYNASSTIAGLQTILTRFLELPSKYLNEEERKKWTEMLNRIPPIPFREIDGHITIAPAKLWERVNNTEVPQLYPVFPWGIYGIGKPGLDTARNTWNYDPDAIQFRSAKGWKQDNIFAARLGLTNEAANLTIQKLQDSERRFPAFWGPGFDWTPDHCQGGSGMIGLQEMLMQTDGKKIYLFPAWPKEWDVHFRFYAPYQTTIEAEFKGGKLVKLIVEPQSRIGDVVNMHGE